MLFRNEFFGLARKLDEPEINNTSIDKVIWKWFFYEYSVGLEIDEPEINKLSIDKAIARLALLGIGTEMCMKLTCVPIV